MRLVNTLLSATLVLGLGTGSLAAQQGEVDVDDIVAELTDALSLSEDQATAVKGHLVQLAMDMDAATAEAEAEEPDGQKMIGDMKQARETYLDSMEDTLSDEQFATYQQMMDEIMQEIFESIAELRITDLVHPLELTDEQAAALKPVMGTAIRGVVAVIFEYGDKRMGVRTKLAMANKLKKIKADADYGMSEILSPEQMQKYQEMKEAQKAEQSG